MLHLVVSLVLLLSSLATPSYAYNRAQLSPVRLRARTLIWRTIAQFSDPANWEPEQRMPCHRDRVILPELYAVYLDFPLEARELVLPSNGLLALGPSGGIRLATKDYDHWQFACGPGGAGIDMFFKPHRVTGETSWYDGRHWALAFDQNSGSLTSTKGRIVSSYATFMHYRSTTGLGGSPNALQVVPHYERIPCAYDRIYLPTNGSYRMRIASQAWAPMPALVTVGDERRLADLISMFGFIKSFYGNLFFDLSEPLSSSSWGRQQFSRGPIEGGGSEASGRSSPLICDNGRSSSAALLCTYVECPRAPCRDPIQPWGFCCAICASTMLVQLRPKQTGGSLAEMFDRIEKALGPVDGSSKDGRPSLSVQFYLHWLDNLSGLQLVVGNLPEAELGASREYLERVRSQLEDVEIFYKINLQNSIDWIIEESTSHTFAIVLLFLFLLSSTSVFMYFYHYHHRADPAFTFVRFRSTGDDIELEPPPTLDYRRESIGSQRETPRSLRNHRQLTPPGSASVCTFETGTSKNLNDHFENPMFLVSRGESE